MAKRKTDDNDRQERERRKERKRLKKEAKKKKKKGDGSTSTLATSQTRSIVPETVENVSDSKVGQEPSLIWKKRVNVAVSILPSGLSNVNASIQYSLRSALLLQYNDAVEGVVLAFDGDHMKILDHGRGMMLDDLPDVHYDVTVDALVFVPAVGASTVGSVTESFHSHLSLVVYEYFNACITSTQLRSCGFEFDELQETWFHRESEKVLEKGTRVHFCIDKLHEAVGIISLDGSKPKLVSM